MSYDFDDNADHSPPIATNYIPPPHDLETIVVLFEVAAIMLTPTTGAQFTYQQLLKQTRGLAGNFVLEDIDAEIVFANMGFLFKKEVNKHFSMK